MEIILKSKSINDSLSCWSDDKCGCDILCYDSVCSCDCHGDYTCNTYNECSCDYRDEECVLYKD